MDRAIIEAQNAVRAAGADQATELFTVAAAIDTAIVIAEGMRERNPGENAQGVIDELEYALLRLPRVAGVAGVNLERNA